MSYQEDKLEEIADAIREVSGTTGTIKASDFAERISRMPKHTILENCGQAFKSDETLIVTPLMDTSRCTSFKDMFNGCVNLKAVYPMDTSSGTNFENMFRYCNQLTSVPEVMDVSKGTSFSYMFRGCSQLTSVPEIMDVSKGIYFNSMFDSCSRLTSVPAVMDVSQGTEFRFMFNNCSQLTEVSFQSDTVRPFGRDMFTGSGITPSSGTIYVPDNLVNQWKQASGWSNYASRIKPLSERP